MLLFKSARTSQPQGAVELNPQETAKLDSILLAGQQGLVTVRGQPWSFFGGAVTSSVNPAGRIAKFPASAAAYRVNDIANSQITVGLVYTPRNNNEQRGLWSLADDSVSGAPHILLQKSGADIRLYTAGGGYIITASGVLTTGVPAAIALSTTIASSGSFEHVLAVNGVVYTAAGTGGGAGKTYEYVMSGYPASGDGDLSLYWLTRSATSKKTLSALTADPKVSPWQIFKPQSRSLPLPGVAAGGGVTAVASDSSASFGIRAAVSSDSSAAYSIRASVSSDAAAAYAIRTNAAADTSAAYDLRSAITSETSASYSILTAGAVTSDSSASYGIRGAVQSDASVAYELRGAVQSSLSAGYDVLAAVPKDASASYALCGAVAQDLTASYAVLALTEVTSDHVASYEVAGAPSVLTAADIAAIWAYGARTLTAAPTASDIADAVWAKTLP